MENEGQVSAVFCMSLYHPMYMKVLINPYTVLEFDVIDLQHCDEVITKEYPGMKGKSQISAEMTGEEVIVNSNDPNVKFDKSPMQVSVYSRIITILY